MERAIFLRALELLRAVGRAGERIPGGDETFIPGGVGILFSIGARRSPPSLGELIPDGRNPVRTLF
jgi:hypothetical protein